MPEENPFNLVDKQYCPDMTKYQRRKSRTVNIGDVALGGSYPIRVQSMTTIDTMDTIGTVEQSIRMIEAGCEYIRITAPSIKEAKNLENIKQELKSRGYNVPLIADIHFTPNAAELAARIIEKVRVNPGNYADKKKFEVIDYDDYAYEAEIERIRDRFTPLVKICKEYGTAMRIGTNHGSLSDRIMSRYGDTPLGMVESALEFLRICEDLNYYDVVLSMKASNTQIMVQAYRLLVQKLDTEGFQPYPLHLGVTEAGEGEDGRIKSAVGIGTLLEDGLGDTVRVSLTEEPEFEAPVAKLLVDRYSDRVNHEPIKPLSALSYDPFSYKKRKTSEVVNIGGGNVPRVIGDLSAYSSLSVKDLKAVGHFYLPELDKWKMNDLGVDFIYTGQNPVEFMLPNGLKEILNYEVWQKVTDKVNKYPLIPIDHYKRDLPDKHDDLNFVLIAAEALEVSKLEIVAKDKTIVLVITTSNPHAMASIRQALVSIALKQITIPVIIKRQYDVMPEEQLQLYAATDVGGLLIDGFGDGIWLAENKSDALSNALNHDKIKCYNSTGFGILQAARTRMSKTEYISCPSCGRTLFDLQETTAMIRKRTDHLKGIKIGIMGCIVNGPGEMADADYGYVGSGKGKITLYKGQEVIKRGVPAEHAVDELIEIIKNDGKWVDKQVVAHV